MDSELLNSPNYLRPFRERTHSPSLDKEVNYQSVDLCVVRNLTVAPWDGMEPPPHRGSLFSLILTNLLQAEHNILLISFVKLSLFMSLIMFFSNVFDWMHALLTHKFSWKRNDPMVFGFIVWCYFVLLLFVLN